jgi:hypothetical protein
MVKTLLKTPHTQPKNAHAYSEVPSQSWRYLGSMLNIQ